MIEKNFETISTNVFSSCLARQEYLWDYVDWIYEIDPDWDWVFIDAYCNMTTDWWGWTLAWKTWYDFPSSSWLDSEVWSVIPSLNINRVFFRYIWYFFFWSYCLS